MLSRSWLDPALLYHLVYSDIFLRRKKKSNSCFSANSHLGKVVLDTDIFKIKARRSAFYSQLCYSFLLNWGKLNILLFLQHFWLGFWYYLSSAFFFIYLDAVLNSVQSVPFCSERAEALIPLKSWLLKQFNSQYDWEVFHEESRHLVPLVIRGTCWRSHVLICA